MSPELIQGIISFIIVVMIVVFLVKKAIALALSIAAILVLFNVAFLWNGDILNEKLGLENYLEPATATTVTDFFNDFAEKRDEFGVLVDSQAVYDKMTETLEDGATILIKGLGQVDIGKFADTMAEKIYEVGSENIDWDELKNEIKTQLDGITEEDLNKLVDEIKNNVDEKET